MATTKYYLFTFADGYQSICRGMSVSERRWEESRHGKLVNKVLYS